MDKELISRWNRIVNEDDEVYVLGDFGARGNEKFILSQLKGTKFLMKGDDCKVILG